MQKPFDHPDFIFELKHDGFRAITYIQNGECKLISRNLNNLLFNSLKRALAKLPVQNAIMDGEIVCLDGYAISQFKQLFNRKTEPVLYAFDLLWLDGEDHRQYLLIVRKERLSDLIRSSNCPRIVYAQHIEQYGKQLFAEICDRDLEGIVAKRRLSIYKDNGTGWLKIKNRSYSQAEGRHETAGAGEVGSVND